MVDDAKPQEPDDDEPTLERQAEFRKAYEANWEVGRAPYQGTYFRTRGEVQWVLKQHDWSGAFDALESAKMGGALLY